MLTAGQIITENAEFSPSDNHPLISLTLFVYQTAVIRATTAADHSSSWTAAQMEVC